MKKNKFLLLILFFITLSYSVIGQVENVVVETYYLSDSLDATDTTGGNILPVDSKTYRIYISLAKGCKMKKIFGDVNHNLSFSSTAIIFNNTDRPTACFGYLLNKNWFPSNPTLGVDSWLTIGMATKAHLGILKSEDPDSSFIGGVHNNGGSAGIPGGLLVNTDPEAGIPLIVADGYIPSSESFAQWTDIGFKDAGGQDTTVFGPVQRGKSFSSNVAVLQQNAGVLGSGSENSVIVAQITTKGEIKFEINVVVIDSSGNELTYVAKNPVGDELLSPYLSYPQVCGCKDPNYLEYSQIYGCNNSDSCKTRIVLGCMDPLSCNYNPSANVNVPELCCYPGFCNDRLLSEVCPDLKKNVSDEALDIQVFPNPVHDKLRISFVNDEMHTSCIQVYNGLARLMKEFTISPLHDPVIILEVSDLPNGIYVLRYQCNAEQKIQKFIKE